MFIYFTILTFKLGHLKKNSLAVLQIAYVLNSELNISSLFRENKYM